MASLRKLFRIQYVSDLHLEHYDKVVFPLLVKPAARYLALAGDIGHVRHQNFRSFLDYTSRNWEHVFYVPGNHEYYQGKSKMWQHHPPATYQSMNECLVDAVSPYKNIHILGAGGAAPPSYYIKDENVAIVGSTLWSHIPAEHLVDARCEMNDYSMIPWEVEGVVCAMHPDDTNELHDTERAIIAEQIQRWGDYGAQVCVLTHHMPSFTLVSPRYVGHHLTTCFASSCEDLMKPHVRAWIYGHTHNAGTGIIGNTITAVNAHGYPGEVVAGFSNQAWLEFPKEAVRADERDAELLSAASKPIEDIVFI